jgi:hypothetical protein
LSYLLCPSINEYDERNLNAQVAQQSDEVPRVDFETRTKSPVFHHRSIAHASAAITACRNAAPAEGIVLAGQSVGIKQVSKQIWLVRFMDYDLGYFDHETCRLEPIQNPFGPKVPRPLEISAPGLMLGKTAPHSGP